MHISKLDYNTLTSKLREKDIKEQTITCLAFYTGHTGIDKQRQAGSHSN